MAAIIIPPSVRRLPDFRCFPHIHGGVRSTDSVLCFLTIARLWAGARLSGDLVSAVRRRDVLRALTLHIFRLVGGKDWALAEESANTRGNRLTDLKRAVSKKREEAAVGAAIALDCAMLAATTCKKRVERMASLATSFQLLPPAPSQRIEMGRNVILRRIAGSANWISELALRLASDPGNVQAWAGDRLSAGLTRLLEATTFARAARFLVLATDRHLQSRAAPGQLYAGWEWT